MFKRLISVNQNPLSVHLSENREFSKNRSWFWIGVTYTHIWVSVRAFGSTYSTRSFSFLFGILIWRRESNILLLTFFTFPWNLLNWMSDPSNFSLVFCTRVTEIHRISLQTHWNSANFSTESYKNFPISLQLNFRYFHIWDCCGWSAEDKLALSFWLLKVRPYCDFLLFFSLISSTMEDPISQYLEINLKYSEVATSLLEFDTCWIDRPAVMYSSQKLQKRERLNFACIWNLKTAKN